MRNMQSRQATIKPCMEKTMSTETMFRKMLSLFTGGQGLSKVFLIQITVGLVQQRMEWIFIIVTMSWN